MLDLSLEEVLCLLLDAADSDLTIDVILLVFKDQRTSCLMAHSAHQDVVDEVTRCIYLDFVPVFEGYPLVAEDVHIGARESRADLILTPPCNLVVVIWPLDQEVRDGWVMAGLFHEDECTILTPSLVSLSQERVQRLLPNLLMVKVTDNSCHEKAHSFYPVLNHGRPIQKYGHGTLYTWGELQL